MGDMPLKDSLRLTPVRRITVHCPVPRETWHARDADRLDLEPALASIFAVLRANPEFGTLGPYHNVLEVAPGHESFTPGRGSSPTLGRAGEATGTGTVAITTYVSARVPERRLEELVAALAAAHPWELPVIEVVGARILAPADLADA